MVADPIVVGRRTGDGAESRLDTLAEISDRLAAELDPRAVLKAAVEGTARLLGADDVRFWRYDAEEDVLRLNVGTDGDETAVGAIVQVGTAAIAGALRASRPFVVDRRDQRALFEALGGAKGSRRGVFVPLTESGRPLGALVAVTAFGWAFDDRDLQLLRILASQVSAALRSARLYQDAQRQAHQLTAILDVNRRLALGPELAEILSRITEEAARLLGASGAALRLLEGDDLVRVARFGFQRTAVGPERMAVGESPGSDLIVAERRPLVSDDFPNDPRFETKLRDGTRANGFTAWLGVPLLGRRDVLGVLSVLGQGGRRFDDADIRLLEAFADQAAVAIENARLFEQAATVEAVRELAELKAKFLSTASHEVSVQEAGAA